MREKEEDLMRSLELVQARTTASSSLAPRLLVGGVDLAVLGDSIRVFDISAYRGKIYVERV